MGNDLEPLPAFPAVVGSQHDPAIANHQAETVFAESDAIKAEAWNLKFGLAPVGVINIGLQQRASFADRRNPAVECRGGEEMVAAFVPWRFRAAEQFPSAIRHWS